MLREALKMTKPVIISDEPQGDRAEVTEEEEQKEEAPEESTVAKGSALCIPLFSAWLNRFCAVFEYDVRE